MSSESRTATVLLLDDAGEIAGALPSFTLELPYWQEAADVVDHVKRHRGIRVWILRLLGAERAHPPGGAVTYLAQIADAHEPAWAHLKTQLLAVPDELRRVAMETQPLRAPWAEPGGPNRSIAWANEVLAARGEIAARPIVQHRTWNLSAIWRFDGEAPEPPVWLKQVPGFMAHEGPVLQWLARAAPALGPRLLAQGPSGRLLLEHVAGVDRYGAAPREREAFLSTWHAAQLASGRALEDLRAAGVPDRRGSRMATFIRSALSGWDLGPSARLVDDLESRLAAVEVCGVPETLVHGDFHPGNVRGHNGVFKILDWGDSTLGHPGLDVLRMSADCAPAARDELLAAWAGRWRHDVPGCEPERSLALLRPLEALRSAAVYAAFIRNIEPSEHPYHFDDVPAQLDKAALLAVQ